MRRFWTWFVVGTFWCFSSTAMELSQWVPNAKLVGKARYEYLFWDVYDIRLEAPDAKWKADAPFALTLTYLREFDGKEIAARSIKEMKEQGLKDKALATRWEEKMRDIFPDVTEQDSLTGIRDNEGYTRFFLNQEPIGMVEDTNFTQRFFDIWLGRKTSEPALREKLLNGETQ